jgi:hypothetical protein
MLKNGTVKVFFLFSPALLGFIILLKSVVKYLAMRTSKVVSVSATEQGDKQFFFQQKGFSEVLRRIVLLPQFLTPRAQKYHHKHHF